MAMVMGDGTAMLMSGNGGVIWPSMRWFMWCKWCLRSQFIFWDNPGKHTLRSTTRLCRWWCQSWRWCHSMCSVGQCTWIRYAIPGPIRHWDWTTWYIIPSINAFCPWYVITEWLLLYFREIALWRRAPASRHRTIVYEESCNCDPWRRYGSYFAESFRVLHDKAITITITITITVILVHTNTPSSPDAVCLAL